MARETDGVNVAVVKVTDVPEAALEVTVPGPAIVTQAAPL
jgi:hypothetical protein